MTWAAPSVDRVDPPRTAPERAALEGWLDYHRDTLLWKCAGLTQEQLARRAVPPSTLSLLGLVRHMADVERSWFRIRVAGEAVPRIYWAQDQDDADFDGVDAADAEQDFETFRREVAAAREIARGRLLDDTFVSSRGNDLDLRWLFLHMIEEYARHNGHADLLRECIDGATGD